MRKTIAMIVLAVVVGAAVVAAAPGLAKAAQADTSYVYTEEFRGMTYVAVDASVYLRDELGVSEEEVEELLIDVAYEVLTQNLPSKIQVVKGWSFEDSAAMVYAAVNAFEKSDGGYFASLDLLVQRNVTLYPAQWGGKDFVATVYEGGYSLYGDDPDDMPSALEGDLRDLLSDLISEFQKAWPNP